MNTSNQRNAASARRAPASHHFLRRLTRSAFAALLLIGALCASGNAAAQTAAAMNVRTVLTSFTDADHSGNVTLGDTLFYSITATNAGGVPLTNVRVNDFSMAANNCATLAVNATCVATASHVVNAQDVTGGAFVEQGHASSNETNDVSNTAFTRVFGNQMTVIVEEHDSSNAGQPTTGEVLHYSVTVTNQNVTGNLTNVHISDPLISPTTTATCATLAPGAVCVLNGSYTVTASDVGIGHVTNTATATSDQVPGGLSYTQTTSVSAPGGFTDVKTTNALTGFADNDHSGTITVGDVLTYTSTVTNAGTLALTSVQISSPLLTPNSVTCASVAPNASCVLTGTHTVTAADAAGGQIIFEPNVNGIGTNHDNGAPVITPVATAGGAAMLVGVSINNLVATGPGGTVIAGSTVQFIVTALNAGNVPLTNVQVSQALTTPNTTTCASVAVGATCVLTGTYTFVAADISTSMFLHFTGTATSTQVPGPVSFTRDVRINGNNADTTSMQTVTGDMQSGAPGSTLPVPLKVRLVGLAGSPLPGFTIGFFVLNNTNGHVTTATAVTDALGEASTQLVLPTTAGPVVVYACVINTGGSGCAPNASFTAFATTATTTPPALTIVAGNNQVLPVNTTSAPMVVQLMNNGSPVVGATINWSGNNVHLTNPTSLTDSNGKASNTATVTATGAASVSASSTSPAAGPVSFSLNGDLASIPGLTPQQQAVAGALNNACPALSSVSNPTPAQQDLLAQCQALGATAGSNPAQAANAINQMLPHDTLIQSNASVLVSSAQFDNIKARMAALRSGAHGGSFGGLAFTSPDGVLQIGRYGNAALGMSDTAKKDDDSSGFDRWGFFASGSFGWGSADARQATPGYGFHTNGLTAGVDYRFNDNWVLGASAGYARYSSSVDTVGGGLDTHGWSLSGYTTLYQKNNWYVDGVLTWSSNSYDINRRIVYSLGATTVNQTATSNSGGDTIAGALTIGRDFNNGPWSFGPYFRGTYSHTNFDGYQETLVTGSGSGLGLAVQSRNLKSVSTVLGAKVNYASSQSWGVLSPHAEVEWEHEYEDNPDTVNARFLADPTSTVFQIKGDPVDTNFFRLGLGLSFTLPKGKSGFVYYEKTLGITGLTQDNLTLGFRMEF